MLLKLLKYNNSETTISNHERVKYIKQAINTHEKYLKNEPLEIPLVLHPMTALHQLYHFNTDIFPYKDVQTVTIHLNCGDSTRLYTQHRQISTDFHQLLYNSTIWEVMHWQLEIDTICTARERRTRLIKL